MLQRSKMADLILRADAYLKTPKQTQIIQLALLQMDHVREIIVSFHGRNAEHIAEMLSQFPRSAPRLQSLHIIPTNPQLQSAISLPDVFPLTDTPCLRQLVLSRCNFLDWDSMLLTDLTYLKVHWANCRSPCQILDGLRRLPASCHLDLQYASSFSGTSMYWGDPVDLPELKQLRLSARMNDVSFILSHVIINQGASVKIMCYGRTGTGDIHPDVNKFVSSLSRFLNADEPHPQFLQLTTQVCSYESPPRVILRLATHTTVPSDCEFFRPIHLPRFAVDLDMDDEHGSPGFLLQTIFPTVRSTSLRALAWSNIGPGINTRLIVDISGRLPNLERIRLKGIRSSPFVDALMHKPSDYNSSPAAWGSVTFPRLYMLEFPQELKVEEIRLLQDCLIERCERNAPLQQLIIELHTDVGDRDVTLLREIVADLQLKS